MAENETSKVIGLEEKKAEMEERRELDKNITHCNFSDNAEQHPEPEETKNPIEEITEDSEITEEQIDYMRRLLKNIRSTLLTFQKIWSDSKKEFQLSVKHMMDLHQFNEQHKTPKPDNNEPWDMYNGLDALTEDDVIAIFGEGHPIIGIQHSQTMDRIKSVVPEYFDWFFMTREYQDTDRGFRSLIAMKEQQDINKMRLMADKMDDGEPKKKILDTIDEYYYIKNLDFLSKPMDPRTLSKIVDAFGSSNTIDYWLSRCRAKLDQIGMPNMFILELSKFEDRYMDEKYHKLSNIFLLYFMNGCVFGFDGIDSSKQNGTISTMIMTLDAVMRKVVNNESRDHIIKNIESLLDQFMDPVFEKYYDKKEESDQT